MHYVSDPLYDVTIVTVVQPDKPASYKFELFQILQDTERDIFNPKVAYDGKKNVFSPRELPLGESGSREAMLLSIHLRSVFNIALFTVHCQ